MRNNYKSPCLCLGEIRQLCVCVCVCVCGEVQDLFFSLTPLRANGVAFLNSALTGLDVGYIYIYIDRERERERETFKHAALLFVVVKSPTRVLHSL